MKYTWLLLDADGTLFDYDKAESVAEELTEIYASYPSGWLILGYTRMLKGDFEGSSQAYEQAVSVGADRGEIQERLAYNYIKMKDWEKWTLSLL